MYLVTGANGFIGSVMVWELNQKGITDILCVDGVSPAERPIPLKGAKYTKFINRDQLWTELNSLDGSQVQAVIHMGACSSTTEMDVDFLRENNTLYTQKLFEWCQNHNVFFIYASSAATYGSGELGFSDLLDPALLKPLNPYGDSKLAFDRWVNDWANERVDKGIDRGADEKGRNGAPKEPVPGESASCWYGLRFFNVYGPNEGHKEAMSSLVHKAFYQVQKTGELGLFKSYRTDYGDGKQLRDFVYVKEVTHWMWELLSKKPKSGVYNMGYGKAHTWLDLAEGVFGALSQPLQIRWLEMPESIRHQYQYFTQADMTKWREAGMPAPRWSLREGIQDVIQNYHLPKVNVFGEGI